MSIYLFENFSYNTDTRELVHAEQRCYLRKKVADVLCYLVENRDRVVGKEELLQAIWDHADYRENSLIQSIRQLRKLFGESAHQPHFIRTVHSKGYEWIYRDIKIKAAVSNITENNVELDDKTDIQPTPHIEATKQSSINKASTELIENKFNILAGTNKEKILDTYYQRSLLFNDNFNVELYGNGNASKIIIQSLLSHFDDS